MFNKPNNKFREYPAFFRTCLDENAGTSSYTFRIFIQTGLVMLRMAPRLFVLDTEA